MRLINDLDFDLFSRLPLLLQTEKTECGLACLGMISGYHGHRYDLRSLRRSFPISQKGATLKDLISIANGLSLGTRALKLELEDLVSLKLPCVLHWDFNHFIVLKKVNSKVIIVHDPAVGERVIPIAEASKHFTGVALELWPNANFAKKDDAKVVKVRDVVGPLQGASRSFAQIIILALVIEVFAIVSPFFLQWTIDNAIVSADRDLMTTLAIGFALLMLMQQTVGTLRSWVIIYMGTTLNLQWRSNVFTHLLQLPMQYFEKRHLGDIVARFSAVDSIQRTLTTSFLEAILDGLMTFVTLSLMFLYSATLGGLAVVTMVLYALSRWFWYKPLRHATEAQIVHAAKQQSHLLESIRGVKAIKLFQRNFERRSAWLTLTVQQMNADLRSQKLQLAYRVVNGVLFGITNILVIWLGALMVMDGDFTIGALMAFNSYKGQFDTRVSSLIDKFFEMKMLNLQADRLADIVMSPPEQMSARSDQLGLQSDCRIEIKDLSFRYSPNDPFVLKQVSFSIFPGESVAIIGASGCGKTTLMNLLLGVLSVEQGDILFGNFSIKQHGASVVRRHVATVLQDDTLFAGSLAENISFFDPEFDQSWIESCAKMACMHDEISSMPMGYNTLVGDMGTVLSGGQKQRILLARALYKRPQVLLLDEATSHLDVRNEKKVNEIISSLEITRVIIAHRPETIASADRIIALRDGCAVELSRPVPIDQVAKV